MSQSRRTFLQSSIATGAGVAALGAMNRPAPAKAPQQAAKPLNILMLGGTAFLGPHTVEAALKRGHAVALFNRGKTNPHLFQKLEKFTGDRDPDKNGGLDSLKRAVASGRKWDVVIDTSGYVPRHVQASVEMLAPRIGQYVFVSSLSVYADNSIVGMDESAPLAALTDPRTEEINNDTYGPLKAMCEQAAQRELPDGATSIRPGLIVGPLDRTHRFTYWPVRVQRGGEVLAPGDHDDPVQYIDVRDLAEFIIRCIEQRHTGAYNVTGPGAPTNIAELLYGCKAVTGGDVTFTWADAAFLARHNVAPWTQLPVWAPPSPDRAGIATVNCRKALKAGLTYRPLADTIKATLDWWNTLNDEDRRGLSRQGGLPPEREREVLDAWHAKTRSTAAN